MRKFFLILLIVCIAVVISCKKPKVYSIIPSIAFVSFQLIDSVDALQNVDKFGILTFSFVDGDGDIGMTDADTIPPYNVTSVYYHDLFINMFSKNKGVYDSVALLIPLYYRLPYYVNTGSDKSLQGKIIVDIQYPDPVPWDTIRYKFYIYDRALHRSNIVTTPDIILK